MSEILVWGLAGGLGALVGAMEIAQRYRAEPLSAVANPWGLGCIALNTSVSLGAFWAVRASDLAAEVSGLELVKWAVLAGVGASVLLRAKLFDIRLADGKAAALGPEIVVQTLLEVLDRELDRARAKRRFATVRKLFAGVDFEKAKLRLPLQLFQAMQRVTEEETQRLMQRVAEVDELQSLGSQDKAYQLGFLLLDLVGEEFLTSVLEKHGDDYRTGLANGDAGAS